MNELFERVLAQLGFHDRPEPTLENLRAIYAAWCRQVPFDNVRKIIHVRTGDPRPFPGNTPEDFLAAWLQHGTGGTCWSNAGASHALLEWLGFKVERGIATMLAAPHLPPNHGTLCVLFGEARYLVDCSILHAEPLRLDETAETRVEHPAWGVRCAPRNGHWHIDWRPLHRTDGFECRLERFGATAAEFAESYERTRAWSPFNYAVTSRTNRGDEVTGVAFGQSVTLHADGSVTQKPITHEERQRLLIEHLGLSEEIVAQLPADLPTPPPPGSATAQRALEAAQPSA